MMKNIMLGEYDMVFAVSESKINYELQTLYKRGAIKKKWQFLTNTSSGGFLNNSGYGFEQVRQAWNHNPHLNEQYNAYIDADIDTPTINLSPGNNQEVLLRIPIKSGSFHYFDYTEIKKADLAGCVYAFRAPVAKVRIDANSMYYAGEDAKQQLRADGLSANDFTVDSIMLNFGRADITHFSAADSKLPIDEKEQDRLKTTISQYFKNLGEDKDNPYVLGYALKKKNLSAREQSMLYPTGTSFSTSVSSVDRSSAFNFMMLMGNRDFPGGQYAGNLQQSLIELTKDKTATVNGVIGIDYRVFEEYYLNNMHYAIVKSFENSFKERQDLGQVSFLFDDNKGRGYTGFGFNKDKLSMQLHLERRKVYQDNGIVVEYDIRIQGVVRTEVEKKFWFLPIGTEQVEQPFSTSGKFPIDNKTGSNGKITITLKASNEGKMHVSAAYQRPIIGRDTEKPQVTNSSMEIWGYVLSVLSPIAMVAIKVVDSIIDPGGKDNLIQGQLFSEIEIFSLDEFSSRVILPGSNVYTFKNIRLEGAPGNDNCMVLFDIAYAIATD